VSVLVSRFYFYFISFLFSIFSRAAVSAVTLPCRPAHLLYLHVVIALCNFEQIKMMMMSIETQSLWKVVYFVTPL